MSNKDKARSLANQFNFSSGKARDIALSLLERAVFQKREDEMMMKISFHFDRAHDMPEEHKEGLALAQIFDVECGQSQALRKSSLRTGSIFRDNSLKRKLIHPAPKGIQ